MNAYRIPAHQAPGPGDSYDHARDDAESRAAVNKADLNDMAESSFWLRRWDREDDSDDAVEARGLLAMLLLERDLPYGTSERADQLRDTYDRLRDELRGCFDHWATGGNPSHLDRYQEVERLAREADQADDAEGWS